jgi:hypothetical protein
MLKMNNIRDKSIKSNAKYLCLMRELEKNKNKLNRKNVGDKL